MNEIKRSGIMALFKKLNEQMEVSKVKKDLGISLTEREAIETELIFGNIFETVDKVMIILSEKLIKPDIAEDKNDFISRFMSDEQAKKEFPENKQRLAVAYSQWERSKRGLKEDLNPKAIDNPEDEEQVKDFDQKETGATEEKEEQLADKTEDIIVATEKE
jgi:hypothetical protein